jgi:methylated-DNA-[protein]-cysteine S-methyltransferase
MVYTVMDTLIGGIVIAGDDSGLRCIDFINDGNPDIIKEEWKRDESFLKPVVEQLNAYFAGRLREFDFTLAPAGTPFQQSVWDALLGIPYGEVASYKQIAETIGNPKAVRAVGAANGKNPLPIVIPCHRVIGANGKLVGYAGGLDIKERLLTLEKENCG